LVILTFSHPPKLSLSLSLSLGGFSSSRSSSDRRLPARYSRDTSNGRTSRRACMHACMHRWFSVFQPLLCPPRRIDSRCVHFSAGPVPSIENPFICITFVFVNNNEIDRCALARDIPPVRASTVDVSIPPSYIFNNAHTHIFFMPAARSLCWRVQLIRFYEIIVFIVSSRREASSLGWRLYFWRGRLEAAALR